MIKNKRNIRFMTALAIGVSCVSVNICIGAPIKQQASATQASAAAVGQKHKTQNGADETSPLYAYYQARKAFQKANLKEQEARTLVAIAQLIRMDSANKSLQHLNDALLIANAIGHTKLKAQIYLAISEIHKGQQHYQQALAALEWHHKLVDSLLVDEKNKEELVLRNADRHSLERIIGLILIASAITISAVLLLFYLRTRKFNRELVELNNIKDRLFSVIGHDLRGPSGSLAQVLELIDETSISLPENKQLFQLVKAQVRSLHDTVETLFHWAGTQQQGLSIHPVEFNPALKVAAIFEFLSGQASQKGVLLSSHIAPAVTVYADLDHFVLIVRNLVANAIKFSNRDTEVQLTNHVEGQMLVFAVSDQGIGMAAERLAKLGSDYMATTFGTAGERGSGLGLQLVEKLVNVNGGSLWAVANQPNGTKVYFSLPIAHKN